MDYQPTGQVPNPAMNQTPEPAPAMNQVPEPSHSNGAWYAIAAVVVIALGLWFYYGTKAPEEQPAGTRASAVEQTEIPALTGGNTTADISADLDQIPDTSAALDAEAAASGAAVSGF